MFVDLLGRLENEALTPLRTIDTPFGRIQLIPVELTVVERVLLAYYPQPDPDAKDVAKKLLAVCLSGGTPVDWDEIERLAALSDFRVTSELKSLRAEVENEIRPAS
jgi:hypothetical protein